MFRQCVSTTSINCSLLSRCYWCYGCYWCFMMTMIDDVVGYLMNHHNLSVPGLVILGTINYNQWSWSFSMVHHLSSCVLVSSHYVPMFIHSGWWISVTVGDIVILIEDLDSPWNSTWFRYIICLVSSIFTEL